MLYVILVKKKEILEVIQSVLHHYSLVTTMLLDLMVIRDTLHGCTGANRLNAAILLEYTNISTYTVLENNDILKKSSKD